ncbi:MAG: DUF6298 domain-containing protein [Candidatus Hinthialibacter sp.]
MNASALMGPLKVHPDNTRYFSDPDGQIVYLTGSHTWAVFQERGIEGQTPYFDYPAFLDFLVEHNHNFFRFWTWEHAAWMQFREKDVRIRYKPLCYMRKGPGKAMDGEPKFDLTKFNPVFFDRLRDRVFAAREKGLYVGVMLFQGFSIEQKGKKGVNPRLGNPWEGHPFHAKNNINGIDGDLNHDGEGEEVHTLADPKILQLQENYVKKMIDVLNGFDNVIWEIGNECSGLSTEWQYHMIRFIKDYEKSKPFQHPVWMTFQWSGHTPGSNVNLFNSPADAVSPNGEGGYQNDPPAATGEKVVISDTDHFDPWMKNIDQTWAWKSFLRGLNPIVMDPYRDVRVDSPEAPVPSFEPMRKALGQTRLFSRIINLSVMTPHNDLCSTGYCLANPGEEYLAYQPESEKLFWVDLPAGSYQVDLFSPREGKIITSIGLNSAERKKQLIPIFFYGDVAAHIKKTDFASDGQQQP